MKTTRLLAAAGAGLMLLGTFSCTQNTCDKKAGNTISFKSLEQQQSYVLQGSAKDYDKDKDLIYSCEASILMPESLDGASADTLQNAILKIAFDTVATNSHDKVIDEGFLASAASLGYTPVDTVVPENTYDGCLIVEGDVAAMSPTILSYAVTVSKYEPMAAHGMYGTYYINYDLKNSKIFNLGDIITADGLAKLPDTLRTIAQSMRGFTGPTDLTALPSEGNFYVDLRDNLVFVYQPYEIASYSQGLIEVPIPAYQISDLMTPYGKALLNL